MKKFFNICILFIILYFCLCSTNITLAVNNDTKVITKEQFEYVNKQYDYLLNDVEKFRDYIQTERTEHRKFLEELYSKTCWGIGILITLFIGIYSFLGWKSYKNIKEQTELYIIDQAKNIVKKANININNQIEILKNRIDDELSYKNAKMYIFNLNKDVEDVMKIFHNKGVGEIVSSKDLKELDKTFCIAIFNINGCKDTDKEFKNIISYLKKEKLNIPFLIYTSNRINNDLLDSCPYYYSLANSKATLIINTFSLLRMFC